MYGSHVQSAEVNLLLCGCWQTYHEHELLDWTSPSGYDFQYFLLLGLQLSIFSAGPSHFGGQTGNLQSRRLVLDPALIFPNLLANLNSDTFKLVLGYAGDKFGGIWISPTSRLGTGGPSYPCVWPSV